MRFQGLSATADLVGHRIRVRWSWHLDLSETPADRPPVRLRRKLRDRAFPAPTLPDPFLVYRDVSFPPAPLPGVLEIDDLPPWTTYDGTLRSEHEAISVSRANGAGALGEVLRRTTSITYGSDGLPVRVEVEILDVGAVLGALDAHRTFYYRLDPDSGPPFDAASSEATARAGQVYGSHLHLWERIPAIYARHDVRVRGRTPGYEAISDRIPEARASGGQLRRFVDMFGVGIDLLRSGADGLRTLHDLDEVDARFLPSLAHWSGWPLGDDTPIEVQRNELRWAPRLYAAAGTPPGLRALVSHYTGWDAQVGEAAQRVLRAATAARRVAMCAEERAGGWRSPRDLAAILGLPAALALGTGSGPAEILGTIAEPFDLRQGQELTLEIDRATPIRVRIGEADLADPRAATAAEVARALDALLDDVQMDVGPGGVLRIRTVSRGPEASLQILEAQRDLVLVRGAPEGRLAACLDETGRVHLFAEAPTDPVPEDLAAPTGVGRRVVHRAWDGTAWRDGGTLPGARRDQGQPAVVPLPGGSLWVAALDGPHRADNRSCFWLGPVPAGEPAEKLGQRAEPFSLVPGSVLRVVTDLGPEIFTVQAADYVDPAHASASEVVVAFGAQMAGARATEQAGVLRLSSTTLGPDARLAIDLSGSTSARALGFGQRGQARRGQWNPTVAWQGPLRGPASAGRQLEPAAAREPDGAVRLVWSLWRGGRSVLATARWRGEGWIGTAAGAARRSGSGWQTLTAADGLPAAEVRGVVEDAMGEVWLATPAGLAQRRVDGTIAVHTLASSALPSDDVRALISTPEGAMLVATAAGLARRDPVGTWQSFTSGSHPLPSDDVRALAVDGEGTAWIGTAAGVVRRDVHGRWLSASAGLQSLDVRTLHVDADGTVWVGTASGVSRWMGEAWGAAEGPAGPVALAGAAGVLWAAAPFELWRSDPARGFRREALPGPGALRDLALQPDGTLEVATQGGLLRRSPSGSWSAITSADGLLSDSLRSVGSHWSAVGLLASERGAHREATLAVDGSGRTWLAWSQRHALQSSGEERWNLCWRRRDPATGSWTATADWTPQTPARQDRQPSLMTQGAGLRVIYLTSDASGPRLAELAVSPSGAASLPTLHSASPDEHTSPQLLRLANGRVWLFHRSDGPLALAQVAEDAQGRVTASQRVPDAATLRTQSGLRTPLLSHAARLGRRSAPDDALSYTHQRPDGSPLTESERVTRNTLILYLSPGRGRPFTQANAVRLMRLLERFLPANLRVVLSLAPRPHLELVYGEGRDIEESWADLMPLVERLGSPSDSTRVRLVGWELVRSNQLDHLTVELADPTTFRRRTWFPDLT